MHPIVEEGSKQRGLAVTDFTRRFSSICREHLDSRRAKAFAFIFYSDEDSTTKQILADERAELDFNRLTANELTVFYLISKSHGTLQRFNELFFGVLRIHPLLPCVVFFTVDDQEVKDIRMAELERLDLITGFHEIYQTLERHILGQSAPPPNRRLTWFKSAMSSLSLEAFKVLIEESLKSYFGG